jgi:hypothetical protein
VLLTPEQRQRSIGQIGQVLAGSVPSGWRQLRAEYRAAGRHIEVDVIVTGPDGVARSVPPPPPVVQLLGNLRAGMYQPGRGTWLGVILVFDPVRPPHAEFVIDEEPRWRRLPPPVGFQDELRFFPRAEQFLPAWLRGRAGVAPGPAVPETLPAGSAEGGEGTATGGGSAGGSGGTASGAGSAEGSGGTASGDGLRTPRVYDGLDEAGRPVVDRAQLPPAERDRVLEYLDAAPVVLAARSYDTDAFDLTREPSVPLNFRTDGTWVWPGAVAYYLREHEVAPDPDLLTHIRARRFILPEVGEPIRDLAIVTVTGQPATED